MKPLNIFALAVSLSAIVIVTFSLIVNYNRAIWFFELVLVIRLTEIIIGLITIPILILMIKDETKPPIQA